MLKLESKELEFITSMLSINRRKLIKEHIWTPEDQVKNKSILDKIYAELKERINQGIYQ